MLINICLYHIFNSKFLQKLSMTHEFMYHAKNESEKISMTHKFHRQMLKVNLPTCDSELVARFEI